MSNSRISENIQSIYADCIRLYTSFFANKQELDFQGWVGDDRGGVALFSDNYFINFSDIVYDVENGIEKNIILDWYEMSKESDNRVHVNFPNYLKMDRK